MRMRPSIVLFVCATTLAAACDRDVRWTESGGEVAGDSSYRVLDYEVTSERYRRWIAAHRALEGVEIGEPVSVDLRNLTESDIERVEESLERHAAAKKSIEGAGMSVQDFVLTTIALAQPWAEANPTLAASINVADPGPAVPPGTNASRGEVRIRRDGADSDSESEGRGRGKGKKKGWMNR